MQSAVPLPLRPLVTTRQAEVTVIARGTQLAGSEDTDVVSAVLALFREDGITVDVNTSVAKVAGHSGEAVMLSLAKADGEQKVTGSDILVAAGRVLQTSGIGLEIAGVRMNSAGFIQVD